MINKIQEIRGDEEFEDHSDYDNSVKEKSKSANQTKKLNKYFFKIHLKEVKWKVWKIQFLEEVQGFVENACSKIPTEILENAIKGMRNRI